MPKLKLLIITPGVKSFSRIEQGQLADAALIFITNPLYQDQFRRYGAVDARFFVDDDFIDDRRLAELVDHAKFLSWNWFLQEGFEDGFTYKNIDLRRLFTQDLVLYLVKALKVIDLYNAILKNYDIGRMVIIDDGSEWGAIAERISRQRKIPAERLFVGNQSVFSLKDILAQTIKNVMRLAHGLAASPLKSGNILYSAALRFVAPFLEKKEGGFYLRDTFSVEAWKMSRRYGFEHILPDTFNARCNSKELGVQCNAMICRIDNFFGKHPFFDLEKMDVWPMIRDDFTRMARQNFFVSMRLISQFLEMFSRFNLKAVLVDEEVCFLNKTLVQVANSLNISTFCLEHGVPLESVGSVPSSVTQILAWGKPSRDRLREWGMPAAKIQLTGAPQFKLAPQIDYATCRVLIKKKSNILPDIKYLLLTAFPFDTNEISTFFRTSWGMKIQESVLAVAIKVLETQKDMHLVLKFHPSDRNLGFSAAIIEKTPPSIRQRIHFVTQFDASVLIGGAYAVLTIASTMYFEALLQEKPVFLFDLKNKRFGEFLAEKYLNLEQPSECAAFLSRCLDPRCVKDGIPFQKNEIAQHFYEENKGAVDRIREILLSSSGVSS